MSCCCRHSLSSRGLQGKCQVSAKSLRLFCAFTGLCWDCATQHSLAGLQVNGRRVAALMLGTQQSRVSPAWAVLLQGTCSHGALLHRGCGNRTCPDVHSTVSIGVFPRGSCLTYCCPSQNSPLLLDLPSLPAMCRALQWPHASRGGCSLLGVTVQTAAAGTWSSGERSPCLLCHHVDGQTRSQGDGGAVAYHPPLSRCPWG